MLTLLTFSGIVFGQLQDYLTITPAGEIIGNPAKRYPITPETGPCSAWQNVLVDHEKTEPIKDYCGVQYIETWVNTRNTNYYAAVNSLELQWRSSPSVAGSTITTVKDSYIGWKYPAQGHVYGQVRGCVARKSNDPIDVGIQVKYWTK